jgi:hypothetical protein
MAHGRAAKQLRQGLLPRLIEVVLVAEEHHLVLQPGCPDRLHGPAIEIGSEANSTYFSADSPPDRDDVERTERRRIGHRAIDLLSRTHGLLLP